MTLNLGFLCKAIKVNKKYSKSSLLVFHFRIVRARRWARIRSLGHFSHFFRRTPYNNSTTWFGGTFQGLIQGSPRCSPQTGNWGASHDRFLVVPHAKHKPDLLFESCLKSKLWNKTFEMVQINQNSIHSGYNNSTICKSRMITELVWLIQVKDYRLF